jgi:threonine/homoserine/homoserine lactone efflux protein
MSLVAFLSAVLALLIAPGPTNTLMGVAGAQAGLGRVVRLLPAELAGYLTTILPLVWLGAEMLARLPAASLVLKLMAAVWVMALAVRMWGLRSAGAVSRPVTARQVFVTTMLNPKALVFGLVLLPAPGQPDFAPRLALFCLMVCCVALLWGAAGALTQLGAGAERRLMLVQRIASLWLGVVALSLIANALQA